MTRIIIRYYDPSYPYLESAIRSIKGDFEIVVYDDGSREFPDLNSVKNRCKIRRLKHRGPASTLIQALIDAKRENVQQVFILDGDDEAQESLPNFLNSSLQLPYTAVIGQFRDEPSPIYKSQGTDLFQEAVANLKFCPPCFSLKLGNWAEELPSVLQMVQTEYLATGTLFLGLFLTRQTGISVTDKVIYWRQHEAQTYRKHHQERLLVGQRIWQIYNQRILEDCSQSLRLHPNNAVAYYNRGNIRSRLGDRQGAIEDYTQALQFNSNFTEAYSNRGVARFDLGDYQGAIADYSQALLRNPNFAQAYNNRGNARLRMGEHLAAIEDLHKAANLFLVQGDVENYKRSHTLLAEAHFNRGITFSRQGKLNEALTCYQKALDIKPDFPPARYQVHTIKKGYEFTTDWFSINLDIWQKYLIHLSQVSGLNILEIGSWEGRSTCWFVDNLLIQDYSKITCIDTFEGSLEQSRYEPIYLRSIESRFNYNISRTEYPEKVCKIVGKSQEILRSLSLESYDVVYIDGSHIASDVLEDAVLSWRLVKVGGIIIFDDYDFVFPESNVQNPKVAIDSFISVFSSKVKVFHQSHQVLVQKIGH